jgi:hypothetical protein
MNGEAKPPPHVRRRSRNNAQNDFPAKLVQLSPYSVQLKCEGVRTNDYRQNGEA